MPIEGKDGIVGKMTPNEKLAWFLERVPLIWLILTIAIIGGVLHSIYKSGGFR